jgi:hypothetical protein
MEMVYGEEQSRDCTTSAEVAREIVKEWSLVDMHDFDVMVERSRPISFS